MTNPDIERATQAYRRARAAIADLLEVAPDLVWLEELPLEVRRAAWDAVTADADRRLTAGRAHGDQLHAQLRDAEARIAQIREELTP